MAKEINTNKKLSFWLASKRSTLGFCPNCGKGRLFKRYLKQVQKCSNCDECLGHIKADDGPAWLTVLVVGHILIPIAVAVAMSTNWKDWIHMLIWPILSIISIMIILPRAKGFFIAMVWHTGCIGAEKED